MITGKITPIKDKIMVSHMEFGEEKTKSGLVVPSDNGKGSGIHPRWARVFAVGPDQHDVEVGEWILLEHGRWSRGIKYRTDSGEELLLHLADNRAVLLVSNEKPSEIMRTIAAGEGSNFNFNIPGA